MHVCIYISIINIHSTHTYIISLVSLTALVNIYIYSAQGYEYTPFEK